MTKVPVIIDVERNEKYTTQTMVVLQGTNIPIDKYGKLDLERVYVVSKDRLSCAKRIENSVYLFIWIKAVRPGLEVRVYILAKPLLGAATYNRAVDYFTIGLKNLHVIHFAYATRENPEDEFIFDRETRNKMKKYENAGTKIRSIWELFSEIIKPTIFLEAGADKITQMKLWLVIYHLPSPAVLEQAFPKILEGEHIGREIIKLLKGYPYWALTNWRKRFREKIKPYLIDLDGLYFTGKRGKAEIQKIFEELVAKYEKLEENVKLLLKGIIPEEWEKSIDPEYIDLIHTYFNEMKKKLLAELENIVNHYIPKIRQVYNYTHQQQASLSVSVIEITKYFAEIKNKIWVINTRLSRDYLDDLVFFIPSSTRMVNRMWNEIPSILERIERAVERLKNDEISISSLLKDIKIADRARLSFVPFYINISEMFTNEEKNEFKKTVEQILSTMQKNINLIIADIIEYLKNRQVMHSNTLDKAMTQLDNFAQVTRDMGLHMESKKIKAVRDLVFGIIAKEPEIIKQNLDQLQKLDRQLAAALKIALPQANISANNEE